VLPCLSGNISKVGTNVHFCMRQKLKYLLRSLKNFNQEKKCPNCGKIAGKLIDEKYFVTNLIKCENCKLNFRHPTDSKESMNSFYQSDYNANYSEETLSITDLPSDKVLVQLMNDNFPNKRDHSTFIKALLKSTSSRVLDFGCSWGYSVYQLKQAGYDAEGFEISQQRAGFGKKLNVIIHHSEETVKGDLDLIMSNHAIEHVPVISDFIKFASSKLRTQGVFMAFCPNGSPEYRQREPDIFHVNWGFLHPNYLDIEFAIKSFSQNPYLILTGDWDYDLKTLSSWDGKSQVVGDKKDGKELLIIAKPNVTIH
jgi:2-polyprenyl-3-methyl-5-hydroxy-6-metoxy-1,4-benzoquinol methylase